jgi:hypothetical protein
MLILYCLIYINSLRILLLATFDLADNYVDADVAASWDVEFKI